MASAERHLFATSDVQNRALMSMAAVSFACHLVFFAMVHVLPGFRPEKKSTLPPVVNVTMVSLPETAAPKAASPKPAKTPPPAAKPPPPKPESAPEPKQKAPVGPSEPIIKHSMKKKTYEASKVVENAISRIEKKVAQEPPDPLQQALDRLRRQVDEAPSPPPSSQAQTEAPPEAGAGPAAGTADGVQKQLELIDIYRMQIAWRVQKNWAFPESLAGDRKDDLVVELAFTVLPNGEIRDVWFDKRSGNRYLDESAKRAVLKSNPVGPHPQGVDRSEITVGLRFTPEGVQ